MAELLVERSDLTGALRWATTGVGLCLGRLGAGWDAGMAVPAPSRAVSSAGGDPTELRLLLTLRYRIRNDLGLPEDDYDKLLDELPSGPGYPGRGQLTPAHGQRVRRGIQVHQDLVAVDHLAGQQRPGELVADGRLDAACAAAGPRRSGRTRSAPAIPGPPA